MNYFDHAASSPLYPEVLQDLAKNNEFHFANPGAKHLLGADLKEKIEEFRVSFLKSLGGNRDDLFLFTSSATESNNLVLLGLPLKEQDEVVYTSADHPSVSAPLQHLQKNKNISLKDIKLTLTGEINEEHFRSLLSEKTKLVVLAHVNNQSGVINDVTRLSKIVKEVSKAHVHVDAAQSFTKINLFNLAHVDSLCITAHKIGGPKGIAGLYLKKNHKVAPIFFGGAQEFGLRSGTESFPLISAFHLAKNISFENKDQKSAHVKMLQQKIKTGLSEMISGIEFPFSETSPYILTFIMPKISSDIILRSLEMHQVYVSSTSACSSKIKGTNPVLTALQIPEHKHKFVMRLSLSSLSTEEDVAVLLEVMKKIWSELCIHI